MNISQIEQRFQSLRNEIEKEVRQQIESKALLIGCDLISTQYSMTVDGPETDSFTDFQDFVYTLFDEYKIELLFEVKNGSFKWL